MEILKVLILAIALLGLGMLGMAIRILVKKGGKFPNTHISGNKYLKSQGIYCSQTQDKLAQREGWKQMKYKKMNLAQDLKTGK